MPWSERARQASFANLIKCYTLISTVLVIVATLIFVTVRVATTTAEIKQAESTAERQVSQTLAQNQQIVDQFATNTQGHLPSLQTYFTASIAQYSNYAIDQSLRGTPYFFWPTESRQLFIKYDQVQQLTVRLTNHKKVFIATAQRPGGALYSEKDVHQPNALRAPLVNPYTLEVDGVVSVSFNQRALIRQLHQLPAARSFQIAVQSLANEDAFYFGGPAVTATQKRQFMQALHDDRLNRLAGYRVTRKRLASNYRLTMAINRTTLRSLLLGRALPLLLLGVGLLLGLSAGLWLTFRRYQHQLDTIVATVKQVSDGDLDARVPVDLKPSDLHTLAAGINAMLTEIHQHIYTIYQLQIAQQEADRKALQAQINPHFMSNTLEYIRMAALDADQPQLANVVYSFAALLRNNTDLSPRTTISQELSFVEKYVFLYQVRFPDQFAYQFDVDPSVAAVQLPKFSLQPLVENYFVHGIDFTRNDNAISVKAWRKGARIYIQLRNNGHDLTSDELTAINQRMRVPFDTAGHQSIGLQNVYSRMADYFGASFQMTVRHNEPQGVQVDLQFNDHNNTKNETSEDGKHDEKIR